MRGEFSPLQWMVFPGWGPPSTHPREWFRGRVFFQVQKTTPNSLLVFSEFLVIRAVFWFSKSLGGGPPSPVARDIPPQDPPSRQERGENGGKSKLPCGSARPPIPVLGGPPEKEMAPNGRGPTIQQQTFFWSPPRGAAEIPPGPEPHQKNRRRPPPSPAPHPSLAGTTQGKTRPPPPPFLQKPFCGNTSFF